jgi:cytochrome oxidase Cu insertion factor (SCO1/SenC/PrrC family)
MTHRMIIGCLIAFVVIASHALAVPGADTAHFEALQLTRLDPAVALPDKRVPNLDGQEVGLRSFQGKVVLINFWTTW